MATISNIIDQDTAKRRLFNKMKALCRDFNWEVRKAITGHISNIFNLLTKEEADKHMFEIMTELLDDEENEVKHLAIEGFFDNINKFTDKCIETNCVELIIDLIKNKETKEFVLEKLDTVIQNCSVLRKHFGCKEYYNSEDEEIRNKVIFNSPSLITALGEKYFIENIYEQYKKLLKDTNIDTRERLAEGMHEMVQAFGTISSYKFGFEKHVSALMLDRSTRVQGALLVHLPKIAEVLIPDDITDQMKEEGLDGKISSYKSTF